MIPTPWHSKLLEIGVEIFKLDVFILIFPFKLTCNLVPGSIEATGSICAGVDDVEVLIARSQHGGNVGATESSQESGTGI